ncbi:MAG: TetR/AcrR family transcriptional regulator [Bacteroidales bacterium]
MKTNNQTRSYNMTRRAQSAAETSENIIRSVLALWKDKPIHEITLESVAEKSGVTIRTILRKFGSRDGLIEACLGHDASTIIEERINAPIGDIDGILKALISNYEKMGEAGIRTIYLENELKEAKDIGEKGRRVHREWCARVFAPFLPDPGHKEYELRLSAFVTATEIYLWKLLRKDMGYDINKTFEVFKMLVEGLVKNFYNP